MSDMNIVAVTGRMTRDPEVKTLPSGTSVCDIGLAVNYSKKLDDGSYEDVPTYLEVSVFGKRGEVIGAKGRKGDSITVNGRLQWRSWEAQDGSKREKVSIVANGVSGELFFRPADGSGTPARADDSEQAPAAPAAPVEAEGDDGIPF